MKRLLYIGNNLRSKSSNVSSIQSLGGLLEQEGYELRYSSSQPNKILRLLDMIWSVLRHMNKVDYVLIDTYSTHNFYFALIISQLCRLLKIRYIPNLNGGNLPARLIKHPRLCRMIFNNSYLNVSPSYYLKDEFNAYGFSNVMYIPNSIELEKYEFRKKNFESIKLLWVRSFSQIYNPSLAIKIQKKIKDLGFICELCMVGPDSDGSLKSLKRLADQMQVQVKFTGKLSKKDWIALSTDYNFFINTTNFDNTPVSVIEAMALGFPVVSTNVGGIPYLIQDHYDGILVEKDNLDGMVQAILDLFLNPSFANEIAGHAREKVEQFDWSKVRYKWIEILK